MGEMTGTEESERTKGKRNGSERRREARRGQSMAGVGKEGKEERKWGNGQGVRTGQREVARC